jgi:hypothetical protein
VSEVRSLDDLVFGSVHGDQRQVAARAFAAALAATMFRVDLADVSRLSRFDVTSPGHHQFAEGCFRTFD